MMMFEKRAAARYLCYAATAIVGTELLYHGVRYGHDLWKRFRNHANAQNAEYEVIWTNELSLACADWHERQSWEERENISNGEEIERPKFTCENPYCFVNNIKRMIEIVDATRYSIDLGMFMFSAQEISEAMVRAAERGVSIRIITDKEMIGARGSQIRPLAKQGILHHAPVYTVMHHKFCVIDGPKRARSAHADYNAEVAKGLVMTGSLNWTKSGLTLNWENLLITNDKATIKQFETEFERMWQTFQEH